MRTGRGGRAFLTGALVAAAIWCLLAPTAGAEPARRRFVEVDARDNEFDARVVTVRRGTWIKFANVGRNDHNIIPTEEDGEFLHVPTKRFEPDESIGIEMAKPGRYRYYCSIHGTRAAGMRGEIVVKG